MMAFSYELPSLRWYRIEMRTEDFNVTVLVKGENESDAIAVARLGQIAKGRTVLSCFAPVYVGPAL